MSTVKKEVIVSKEANELAESLVGLVKSSKEHVKDGFQAGKDIPAILLENMQSVLKGIEGVDKMGDEAKENMSAFINAWVLAGTEIAGIFFVRSGRHLMTVAYTS